MGGFVLKLKLWWETADRTQRTVTIGGGLFLIFMIGITSMLAMRPHMAVAFGGLNSADQGMVVTELEKAGIPTEANERGDVLVPSDKVTEAKIKLATAGKLPTANYGDEALAKLGIMDTPAVEKERLKTILEGRISDTISGISGIGTAQVHLVLADDSPFVREAKPATASISITEKAGSSVTQDQGQVIATLVANSVPGLSINNISVVNNRMEMLYDGSDHNSAPGRASQKLQAEIAEGRRRSSELQSMLDSVYGPGAAIAKVNLTLDFDEKSETTDDNVPTKIVASKTEESMTGNKPTGIAAGAPATPAAGAAGGDYKMTQTANEVAMKVTHTELHPTGGSVKSEAVSVIFNSAKAGDPKDPTKEPDAAKLATMTASVQGIVDGYLGKPKGGELPTGITSTVTSVNFDTTVATASKAAADSAKSSQMIQQIISLLPIAALIFVGFLVMKSIGKFSKGTSMALVGGSSLPVPYNPSALPASSGDLLRAVERQSGGEGGGQFNRRADDIGGGDDDDESDAQLASIKGISRKVNVPLEQIRKMSSDRPETVAMLIKGWLLEER